MDVTFCDFYYFLLLSLFLDPFLKVINAGVTIMCTEVIMTTLSPSWNPFTLELRDIGKLCVFIF